MSPPELPDGWEASTIGDVTDRAGQRVPEPAEQFHYIDIGSIDRQTKRIVSPQALAGEIAPSRARQVVQAGDVLVSMTRPNLNAVAMVSTELEGQIASTGFDVLRAVEVDPRWIFAAVRTPAFVTSMTELVQGALYPAVRPRDVRGFQLPIPPLNEQKRIADKLDALVAWVDACRERLDRIPGILKRFRQSVLAAATSGELTADWREERGLGMDWISSTFGEQGEVSGGLTKNSRRESLPLKRKYLRVANVYADRLELSDVQEIGLTQQEFDKTRLLVGDVLIVEGNGSRDQIGRAALWNGEVPDCSHQNHLIRWRSSESVLPRFAVAWLLSPNGRSLLVERASTTTGLYTLSVSKVASIPIGVPTVAEQAEIIRRMDVLFADLGRLESTFTEALKHTESLTPAFFAKAFRGELVNQDPEDEPASVLLERIRAARAAETNAGRKGKRNGRRFQVIVESDAPDPEMAEAAAGAS
ncbi:MAG: restriction endonuclease subunit S [Dehalococcoidia bacterium]